MYRQLQLINLGMDASAVAGLMQSDFRFGTFDSAAACVECTRVMFAYILNVMLRVHDLVLDFAVLLAIEILKENVSSR